MGKYCDNERLKVVINLYNKLNIYDTGDWCPVYLQRQEKQFQSNKITAEEWEECRGFIHRRVKAIEKLQDEYAAMNGDEKRKFVYEFKKIKDELCEMVIKITNGRINSFRLRTQPKLIEHIDDIIQDAVINVFRYINRFDEERGTSAFAYVTQLISNAIKLDLKKIEEHNNTYISGVDYFDNLNTVDDPHDGVNGLANFIE